MTSLTGTDAPDTLQGAAFNDLLAGQQGSDRLFGGDGNDTLIGGRDNDMLMGEAGDDLLQGAHGNDWLFADIGSDTLDGGEGNDTLTANGNGPWGWGLPPAGTVPTQLLGGAGSDSLIGEAGANVTYIGGEGNDTITERAGGTIIIGLHTGQDLVNLEGNGATLRFEAGIRPEDVRVLIHYDIMTISLLNGSSVVCVTTYRGQLGAIAFDNGVAWNPDEIVTRSALGTLGNDDMQLRKPGSSIWAGDGADLITALSSGQMYGQGGNDTLTFTDFNQGLLDGGDGMDVLHGGAWEDTLVGGRGDDLLDGSLGRDHYVYNAGDGHDRIIEWDWSSPSSPQDTIDQAAVVELGAGITRGSLQLYRDVNDLILQPLGGPTDGGDQLRLVDYFVHTHTTSVIQFSDGSWLTPTDIDQLATLVPHPDHISVQGSIGDDELSTAWGEATLAGGAGRDTLDARHGSGELIGGEGSDTYLWGLGSGSVTINAGVGANQVGYDRDVVQLGAGITADMLRLSLTGLQGPKGFVVSIDGHEATLTLRGTADGAPFNGLPDLQFADGSMMFTGQLVDTWMRQDPAAFAWMLGGNDTLSSAQDADGTAYGGRGGDTYIVGRHNSLARIVPTYTPFRNDPDYDLIKLQSWTADGNVLRFVDGIRPQDIVTDSQPGQLLGNPGDLTLRLRDSDRQVVLAGYMQDYNYGLSEVNEVRFDDGTSWGYNDLITLWMHQSPVGLSMMGGMQDDLIVGEDGDDWLAGGAGNDTLQGESGNNTLEGGAGSDWYRVASGSDLVIEQTAFNEEDNLDTIETSVTFQASDNIEEMWAATDAVGVDLYAGTHGIGLWGNSMANHLYGSVESDILCGGAGPDTLHGGEGDDFYYFIDAKETVEELSGQGTDSVLTCVANTTLADEVERLILFAPPALNGTGNKLANFIQGNQRGNMLKGLEGDDQINAGAGNDTLIGGIGQDLLVGASGNDTYQFTRGDGVDKVIDTDATTGNQDHLSFDASIANDQLWFSKSGQDLSIQVVGSADQVSITNWYQGAANQVEFIEAGGKSLKNTQVNVLVDAMSTLTPPAAGQTTLSADTLNKLAPALKSAWGT
jgi:Ca2+-binding RTX toxin-like protein